MRVLVVGSHGKVGRRLVPLLVRSGHEVVAMIRDGDQTTAMQELGARPLIADLEHEVSFAPQGCDAVVFTAGAGAGSGAARKQTVDRAGAEKLVDAALEHGVRRYLMVSSIGAHDPAVGGEALRPYLQAKRQADDHLMASGLDWTIVRPGSLHDRPGEGRVTVSDQLGGSGPVSRDNVAMVLAAVLEDLRTVGLLFELFDGDTPLDRALESLLADRAQR